MGIEYNPLLRIGLDKTGSGGAAVSSVSSSDPSLRVTPTTGAVIIYAFNPLFYSYFGGF